MFLVALHRGRVDGALVFGAETAHSAVVRIALEAVFGHKATRLLLVHFKGLFPPPYAPVVAVAMCDAFGMTPAEEWRAGDVRTLQRVVLLNGAGQNAFLTEEGINAMLQYFALGGSPLVLLLPTPVFPAVLHLVIATPHHHTGMLRYAAYLLRSLFFDIVEESAVGGIEGTTEVEIDPHHETQRVAKVKEVVRLVNSTSPHSEHVKIGLLGGGEQVAVACTVGTVEHGERMNRNPVGTLHKKGLAVTIEGEALADGVLFLLQRHTPRLGFSHRLFGQVVIVAL